MSVCPAAIILHLYSLTYANITLDDSKNSQLVDCQNHWLTLCIVVEKSFICGFSAMSQVTVVMHDLRVCSVGR